MLDAPPTMTADQVAEALQLADATAFLARRPRLQSTHGFPRQLPGLHARWSRRQVMAWIEAGGSPEPDAVEPAFNPVGDARAALEQRYNVGRAQ